MKSTTDLLTGIFKLRGVVRNYDWGGTGYLSSLLSIPNIQQQPMAEYWLGAHDSAPAVMLHGDEEIPLNAAIRQSPSILGETVMSRFHRLPFLLKILDVKKMLSIQVHPSKHTAEAEFARENHEKIPLDAAVRNYKDDNHKPELMVALSPFWLLHGFKPVDRMRDRLQAIPEFKSLLDIFNATGYDQLYKTVMEMPRERVDEVLRPVIERSLPAYRSGALQKNNEDFWAARA
ncbi:MAG TPA: mannose-6-phosphate isomerase, class I, partial [Chitinophagaceae bacterium]